MSEAVSEKIKDPFDILYNINVNEHVEEKDTGRVKLKYLSWSWAWKEIRSRFPEVEYYIVEDNVTGLPYHDSPLGLFVETTVTIGNETHPMILPVMDSSNASMRSTEYTIKTKYGEKVIAAATFFDINKAIMRCLAKNFAMFGLGLYIYSGEDLPEEPEEIKTAKKIEEEQKQELLKEIIETVHKLIKAKTKTMSTDEKKKFGNEVIVPIIGTMDYLSCKDYNKLEKLFQTLNKGDK